MNKSRHKALVALADKGKDYSQRFKTKGQALEYFRAKIDKKKLPTFKHKKEVKSPYKKLLIEEYEEKYK